LSVPATCFGASDHHRAFKRMILKIKTKYMQLQDVQLKSGPYFNMTSLFTNIYNMLCYTTNLYLQ